MVESALIILLGIVGAVLALLTAFTAFMLFEVAEDLLRAYLTHQRALRIRLYLDNLVLAVMIFLSFAVPTAMTFSVLLNLLGAAK